MYAGIQSWDTEVPQNNTQRLLEHIAEINKHLTRTTIQSSHEAWEHVGSLNIDKDIPAKLLRDGLVLVCENATITIHDTNTIMRSIDISSYIGQEVDSIRVHTIHDINETTVILAGYSNSFEYHTVLDWSNGTIKSHYASPQNMGYPPLRVFGMAFGQHYNSTGGGYSLFEQTGDCSMFYEFKMRYHNSGNGGMPILPYGNGLVMVNCLALNTQVVDMATQQVLHQFDLPTPKNDHFLRIENQSVLDQRTLILATHKTGYVVDVQTGTVLKMKKMFPCDRLITLGGGYSAVSREYGSNSYDIIDRNFNVVRKLSNVYDVGTDFLQEYVFWRDEKQMHVYRKTRGTIKCYLIRATAFFDIEIIQDDKNQSREGRSPATKRIRL
jgi:hypothetical protein